MTIYNKSKVNIRAMKFFRILIVVLHLKCMYNVKLIGDVILYVIQECQANMLIDIKNVGNVCDEYLKKYAWE